MVKNSQFSRTDRYDHKCWTRVTGSVRVWPGPEEDKAHGGQRQHGKVGREGFFFRDKEEIGRRVRRC